MSRLTREGTAKPVSRDQILRHARGQGQYYFPCSDDHEQYWQPYPVDPYSAICDDHTYIHTYIYDDDHTCYMHWAYEYALSYHNNENEKSYRPCSVEDFSYRTYYSIVCTLIPQYSYVYSVCDLQVVQERATSRNMS